MKTKLVSIIFLASVLSLFAARPLFAGNDPLWDSAEERAWRSRDLVAGVITTRTEVADGDGQTLEIIDETDRLTGWKEGQPVRTSETKKTVVHASGVAVKFNLSAASNVFVAAHEGRVTRSFVRDEMLNGRKCAVYKVAESPVPGKDEKALAGEVWIDRETSVPVQGVYQPVKMPANVKAYHITIAYAAVGDQWAPAKMSIQAAGGMMFVKRNLKVEKSFSGWTTPGK